MCVLRQLNVATAQATGGSRISYGRWEHYRNRRRSDQWEAKTYQVGAKLYRRGADARTQEEGRGGVVKRVVSVAINLSGGTATFSGGAGRLIGRSTPLASGSAYDLHNVLFTCAFVNVFALRCSYLPAAWIRLWVKRPIFRAGLNKTTPTQPSPNIQTQVCECSLMSVLIKVVHTVCYKRCFYRSKSVLFRF